MDRVPLPSVRAILFTDMLGSTELRSRLGEDRADALRRVHDDLPGRAVTEHLGEVLRWTGDGLKAEFASASAATSAAIAMQRAVAKYGRGAHAIAPFQIRIGLGVGEVTTEDGDIHGVAVIEAGRSGVQQSIDELAQRYDGTHADTAGTWAVQTGGMAIQAGSLGSLVPTVRAMHESSGLTPQWAAAFGLALVASGDRASAQAVFDDFDVPSVDYFWLTTLQAISEVAVALERRDRIPVLRELLAPYREQLGITASGSLIFGLVGTTLGQLALALGDHAAAIELLEEAVARADSMGAPFEATKARRVLAAAMIDGGGPPGRIEAVITHATDLARRHEFRGEAELLAQISLARATADLSAPPVGSR